MKRIRVIILICVFVLSLSSCLKNDTVKPSSIELIENESYFSDFEVKDELVYIKCYLTIQNSNESDKVFTISADFDKDVEIGLLKDATIYACDSQGQKQVFLLSSNTKEKFDCVFVGAYGGTMKKTNRNLPSNITLQVENN